MKTSKIFREAKAHLSFYHDERDGKHRCICMTLLCLQDRHVICIKDRLRCKNLIDSLLEGCPTLEVWLLKHRHVHPSQWNREPERMQITRHAWLDHLIAHYESIGD